MQVELQYSLCLVLKIVSACLGVRVMRFPVNERLQV